MLLDAVQFPITKKANHLDLAPTVHYATKALLPSDFHIARRIYDFFLCYVIQGEFEVALADKKTIRCPERTMFYIPAGVWHQNRVTSPQGVSYMALHFNFFADMAPLQPDEITVDEQHIAMERFCREPEWADGNPPLQQETLLPSAQAVNLMEQILQQFQNRSPLYELCTRGLMLQLFALLINERNRTNQIVYPSKYDEQMLHLANLLEQQYDQSWSSQRMAGILNLHEDYVPRLFKSIFGLTPSGYVQAIRLREAKRLLRETDMKVESIGVQVGYRDLHYFSRLFHKLAGCSPTDYRRSMTFF